MALSLTGSSPTQARTAPAPHSRRWRWGRDDLKQCNHSTNYFISVPTVKYTLITLKRSWWINWALGSCMIKRYGTTVLPVCCNTSAMEKSVGMSVSWKCICGFQTHESPPAGVLLWPSITIPFPGSSYPHISPGPGGSWPSYCDGVPASYWRFFFFSRLTWA